MLLTYTGSQTASHDLREADVSLESLLSSIPEGSKDGEALIPARFKDCGTKCQSRNRKCEGNRPHRIDNNTVEITALVYDIDKETTPERIQAALQGLMARGIGFGYWNTHSNGAKNSEGLPLIKARVIIPLATPFPVEGTHEDWKERVWPALRDALGFGAIADTQCCNTSRFYYLPRRPKGSDPSNYESFFVPGLAFDWRGTVEVGAPKKAVSFDVPVIPRVEEDPDKLVDVVAIRDRLKGSTSIYAKRLGRGEALSPPPEKRGLDDAPRKIAWVRALASLAWHADPKDSSTVLLEELCKPSFAAEHAQSQDEATPWEHVVNTLALKREETPALKVQRKLEQEAGIEALRNAVKGVMKQREPTSDAEEPEDAPAPTTEDAPNEEDWAQRLTWTVRKEGPFLENHRHNAALLLEHGEEWAGTLCLNEANRQVEIRGSPPIPGPTPRQITDIDFAEIANWFKRQPKQFSLSLPTTDIREAVKVAASHRTFDAIKESLAALPEWDGVPRKRTFLREILKVSADGAEGEDISDLIDTVSALTVDSLVTRGMRPGCKLDQVLVLEGKQGRHKTTALQIMSLGHFSSDTIDPNNKDHVLQMNKRLLVELAEMETYSKRDAGEMKAFITRVEDNVREPYGHANITLKRRPVFIGTVNKAQYLQDETGERRYWPVEVGAYIDTNRLAAEWPQIMAEGMHAFKEAEACPDCAAKDEATKGTIIRCDLHKYWLPRELERQMARLAEMHKETNVYAEAIKAYVLEIKRGDRPLFLPTQFIIEKVLMKPLDQREARSVGVAMQLLGAKPWRGLVRGVLVRGYRLPDELLNEPGGTKIRLADLPVAEVTEATA
jgi:predicted P-loop ATPase